MDIREVIKAVNQMQADGVIERYAIGGAVGATFYLEPVATQSVPLFLAGQAGGTLAALAVFGWLLKEPAADA